jgi:hypothetical protein
LLEKAFLHIVKLVSVDQIKTAIEQLSFEERAELAAWLHGWKDDEWDEQMKRDVAAGKLDHILREVDEDIRAEKLREMP